MDESPFRPKESGRPGLSYFHRVSRLAESDEAELSDCLALLGSLSLGRTIGDGGKRIGKAWRMHHLSQTHHNLAYGVQS